jgi:hypothetical protein
MIIYNRMGKDNLSGKSRKRREAINMLGVPQGNLNNATAKSRKRRVTATNLPSLKYSFDALDMKVTDILKSIKNPTDRIKKFQTVWKEIFGRPVEKVAAEAYILVRAKPHYGKKTRKQGGGGMPISGAPLDFQTRPGVDGVHGSFPPYLTSGLSFYNTVNQDQLNAGVRLNDFNRGVPEDMGSNLVGGGTLSDSLSVFTTRPAASQIPPTVINDAQTFIQGKPLPASPDSSQNPLKYM